MTDIVSETSRDEHSEYTDLDDSCSTTSTLDSFVPDTMSPVHESEDKPIMKHLKAKLKGSKNNTIQALHVQNSPHMTLKFGALLDDDHEGLLSEIHHNRTYKMPVMEEDYSNQLGRRTKKGKRKAGKDKKFKFEVIEKCTSCDVHVATIEILEKKREKSKDKKQAMEQRCDDLQEQCDDYRGKCDDYRGKCDDLQKQCNDQQKQLDDYREKFDDQQRELNESQEKVKLLENGCASCEERTQQEMRTLNEKIKMLTEQNEKFTFELNMAECRFEEELNAYKENSYREKEELIATMNVQLKKEKEAHNATKVDLEAKCKILNCERQERATMVDNLDKENNSKAEQILRLEEEAKRQEESWKQMMAVLQEKVIGLKKRNEELTHEKNFQLASRQDLANELNAYKETSHLEKEEVIATTKAEVEQLKNTIKFLNTKNTNQRKIHDDMASTIDVLDEKNEDKDAELNELRDKLNDLRDTLNEVSTRANNLLIHNGELQRIVNDLDASLQAMVQAFEGREEDVQDLRDQLRRIIDGLRSSQQLRQPDIDGQLLSQQHRQPDNHGYLQLPSEQVVITALRVEEASHVHVPV